MKILNNQEVQAISGADHSTLHTILEAPHLFMGLVEFTNWAGNLWVNGTSNIAEDDYFTRIVTYPFTYFSNEK